MSNTNRSKPDAADTGNPSIDVSPEAIGERFKRTWQLTIAKWAAEGIDITKLPMRRGVERLIRLKNNTLNIKLV